MKLTQYHKDAIVRSILNDIPTKDGKTEKAKAQAALVKGMGRSCKTIYKTNPTALADVYVSGHEYPFGGYGQSLICGDADSTAILEPFRKQKKERDDIETKIKGVLKGINTRKQFIDLFPEFSAYAPPEEGSCSTLPAISNVIADLVKVGWTQKVSKPK